MRFGVVCVWRESKWIDPLLQLLLWMSMMKSAVGIVILSKRRFGRISPQPAAAIFDQNGSLQRRC